MSDAAALGGLSQTPGYQGLQQQRQDPGGFEAITGTSSSPPPSVGQQIGTAIGGFLDAASSGFRQITNIFKNDSTILGENLGAAGQAKPFESAQPHHIVPINDPRAGPAQQKLIDLGIPLNSAPNGVWLPGPNSPQGAPGAYHPRLNNTDYISEVNRALTGPLSRPEAEAILQEIGKRLSEGNFPGVRPR